MGATTNRDHYWNYTGTYIYMDCDNLLVLSLMEWLVKEFIANDTVIAVKIHYVQKMICLGFAVVISFMLLEVRLMLFLPNVGI